MQLINFIEKETASSSSKIIFFMVVISGIANSLLLAIVNHATQAVSDNQDLTQYFFLYLIAFCLFLYGQWFAFERAILAIEDAIYNIRIRLTRKIQRVELTFIEKTGSNNLYSRLTTSDTLIAQATPQITSAAQLSVLMIFSFIYLAYISPISFVILMISIVIGIFLFTSKSKSVKKSLQQVKKKEAEYFKSISHLINGFKEIKINKEKADHILKSIEKTSNETKQIKFEVGKQESKMWGFGRVFVYVLLPILVFIVPSFNEEHAADIFKVSSTMLFIIGPITILVSAMPIINRVNIAITDLMNLEEEMDLAIDQETDDRENIFPDFKEIRLKDVSFTYPDSVVSFYSGPFNEHIYKGELLFIIGGNGSGKSTFLKLLTGLYHPNSGNIYVDSTPVGDTDYTDYRSLFSVVFTDFHLFDKFYGIKDINKEKVNYWLKKMRMEHKVTFRNGGFDSTNFSTGQRKRLAFIAAMLEDKPILIIDEFAADQDPQFRQYFYETLLLELKEMGKTVVAVTHDDHYFHVADRVLKMDEGVLVPLDERKSER